MTTACFAPHKAPVRKMRQKPDRAKKTFVTTCSMMNVTGEMTRYSDIRWLLSRLMARDDRGGHVGNRGRARRRAGAVSGL